MTSMHILIQSRDQPSKRAEQRAQRTRRELERTNGKNATVIAKKRDQVMGKTIYRRPPIKRPLHPDTGLRSKEYVRKEGLVAVIGNTAPYARARNNMTGTSKLYGHDLTSDWAGHGVRDTRGERRANVRAALRRIMTLKN